MKYALLSLFLFAQVALGEYVQDNSITQKKLNTQVYESTAIKNCTIATSVGSNALTIALKNNLGADPTSLSPCQVTFRNATANNGVYSRATITAASSLVISNGSTLGTQNAVPKYLFVYVLNNSGAIELAVSGINFDEGTVRTTTAEGGAGAADSGKILYSTTARAGVPIRFLARIKVTEATAGTWATAPSEISPTPNDSRDYVTVSARISTAAPTLTRQDGNWIASLTKNATGTVTINFTTDFFSDIPNCNCTLYGNRIFCDQTTTDTRAAVRFESVSAIGTLTESNMSIICVGPK